MKKYEFRLAQVRRVRSTQENLAKSDLLAANVEVRRAVATVEACLSDYDDASARGIFSGGLDAFMSTRYLNELAGQSVLEARRRQAAAEEQAAIKRQAWVEAATKLKALDRLDERRREEYRIELERETNRELDDLVNGRWGR